MKAGRVRSIQVRQGMCVFNLNVCWSSETRAWARRRGAGTLRVSCAVCLSACYAMSWTDLASVDPRANAGVRDKTSRTPLQYLVSQICVECAVRWPVLTQRVVLSGEYWREQRSSSADRSGRRDRGARSAQSESARVCCQDGDVSGFVKRP
eukprot:1435867-Rhodomonas_salina.1